MPGSPSPWRRRIRRTALTLLAVLLIAGAWFGAEVYRALHATPGPIADCAARYQQLVDKYQSDYLSEPNAWPLVTDAIEVYRQAAFPADGPTYEGEQVAIDFCLFTGPETEGSALHYDMPEPVLRAAATEALARVDASGLYDLLAALPSNRRAFRPAQEGAMITWILPELGAARRIGIANIIRMRRAHDAGDDAAVVAPFEQSLALSRIFAQQVTGLDHTVASTIVQFATRELRCELAERPPPTAELRELLAAMDRQLPLPPLEVAIEGERLMALDVIDRVHTAAGRVIIPTLVELTGDTPFGTLTPPPAISNLKAIWMARKAESVRLCNEYYDDAVAGSKLRRADHHGTTRRGDIYDMTGADPKRYMVLIPLLVATGKPYSDRGNAEVAIAGTRLMLAVELYRAETGSLPAGLSDLVPAYLPELPQDQWAADGFRYRRTDGGYLLYSIAADLTDDGGKPHPDTPLRAFHPTGKGYDFVFNTPRRPFRQDLRFPEDVPPSDEDTDGE